MTIQFKPKTGGRGIEWCDETRNATGGCMHDCRWKMPNGEVAVCYAKTLAETGVARADTQMALSVIIGGRKCSNNSLPEKSRA